jgi:hypothetical protein
MQNIKNIKKPRPTGADQQCKMGAETASPAQNSSTAGIANGPDAISTGTSD